MLRYGIIGAGNMGQEHIRYLKMLPDAQATAIADPDREMRESAAALAGPDTLAYADYRDLLSAGHADALVIASPNAAFPPRPSPLACGNPASWTASRSRLMMICWPPANTTARLSSSTSGFSTWSGTAGPRMFHFTTG